MGKTGGRIVSGERVIHRRRRSRGTLVGGHDKDLLVVDFDDGGPQNTHVDSVRRLLQKDLLKEERFQTGNTVRDATTDLVGVVADTPNGDRVTVAFGRAKKIIPARHLIRE